MKNNFKGIIVFIFVLISIFALSACNLTSANNTEQISRACQITAVDDNFTLEDDEIKGVVSKSATWIDFAGIITVSEGAQFKVYSDFEGKDELAAKRAYIPDEVNTFYIIVTSQSGDMKIYTIEIIKADTFKVTFNAMGGKVENVSAKTIEVIAGNLITPLEATYTGYTFIGWYDNAEYEGEPVNFEEYTANQDITFFAKWQKDVEETENIKVTFNANGGKFDDETAIFEYSATINGVINPEDIPVPDLDGKVFAGWCVMEEDGETLSEVIDFSEYVAEEGTVFYAKYVEPSMIN